MRRLSTSSSILLNSSGDDTVSEKSEDKTSLEQADDGVGLNQVEPSEDDNEAVQNSADEDDIDQIDGAIDSGSSRQRKRKPPSKFSDFILYQSFISKDVPSTYREALACDDNGLWMEAMKKEIEAISTYDVWELVDRPKDQKVVKCKWVYSV